MSSLLCVPPIVEITRIPKLVVDFTSVPLTERRIGAFVPMGFIGTTRRSKSFERAQMHETRIPRWQIVDSIFYYFPKYSIFSTFFPFFLISSLDYIWCPTALQLDTLKLDTLKTLLLGYSTFCYCTRPEFKSTAEFFLFKKLHQQIYTATLLLPRKTIIFKVLFTECVHFTAIPSSSCFFSFCYF